MALDEQRSHEDLTEDPSSHRLEDLRQKGQIAQSKEFSAVCALAATGYGAMILLPQLLEIWIAFMQTLIFPSQTGIFLNHDLMLKTLTIIVVSAGPICGAGFLFGLLGSFLQVGAVFTLEPLVFDFSRIDPLAGLKRLFSKKILLEGLKMSCKLFFLMGLVFLMIRTEVFSSGILVWMSLMASSGVIGSKAIALFTSCFMVLLAFAGLDIWWVRREYGKSTRMTKQEAKQDVKERDGDPQIKARIRAIQRQMAKKRMMQAVKKADVIVTNPTHIAVAIAYQGTKMRAPLVVAKGADLMAQKIKEIAHLSGIPCVENVALARELYKKVKLGAMIPRNMYQAIAEILAYVYRLNRSKKQ